ncbi:hypothetical protein CYMTET_12019 [Cymbomonas tetramitiformis]|uniref:Uncharacterized protein n=1 Tax=Cymbomonas tetramitiformis TaxID=36881 RepID=A0AAE0LCV6_9CHLO|nr:hypothetical protein CYMTET_12019 [Cymbomonas tetramitiformis]
MFHHGAGSLMGIIPDLSLLVHGELYDALDGDAVRQQSERVGDIVDIGDDHYVKKRSPPGSKHGLQEWMCVRGGKVESLHTEKGHFANQGMNPFLAQALTIEGIIQFTMNKQREVWYDAHQATNPVVEHYKPWLRLEANHLAQVVALPTPYPEQVGIATRVDGAVRTYMVNCPNEAARQIVDRAEVLEEGGPAQPPPPATAAAGSNHAVGGTQHSPAPQEQAGPAQPPPPATAAAGSDHAVGGTQHSPAPQNQAGPAQPPPPATAAAGSDHAVGGTQHSPAPQDQAGPAQPPPPATAAAGSDHAVGGTQHSPTPQDQAGPAQPPPPPAAVGSDHAAGGAQHSPTPQDQAGPAQPLPPPATTAAGRDHAAGGMQHLPAPQDQAGEHAMSLTLLQMLITTFITPLRYHMGMGVLTSPAQPLPPPATAAAGRDHAAGGMQHLPAPQDQAGPAQQVAARHRRRRQRPC